MERREFRPPALIRRMHLQRSILIYEAHDRFVTLIVLTHFLNGCDIILDQGSPPATRQDYGWTEDGVHMSDQYRADQKRADQEHADQEHSPEHALPQPSISLVRRERWKTNMTLLSRRLEQASGAYCREVGAPPVYWKCRVGCAASRCTPWITARDGQQSPSFARPSSSRAMASAPGSGTPSRCEDET